MESEKFSAEAATAQTSGGWTALHFAANKGRGDIVKIQENPFEPALEGPVRELFETLAPHMPFPNGFLFSNLWLFDGIVTGQLAKKNSTNALVRTTIAPTMLSGSIKDNILPTEARAVIKFSASFKPS